MKKIKLQKEVKESQDSKTTEEDSLMMQVQKPQIVRYDSLPEFKVDITRKDTPIIKDNKSLQTRQVSAKELTSQSEHIKTLESTIKAYKNHVAELVQTIGNMEEENEFLRNEKAAFDIDKDLLKLEKDEIIENLKKENIRLKEDLKKMNELIKTKEKGAIEMLENEKRLLLEKFCAERASYQKLLKERGENLQNEVMRGLNIGHNRTPNVSLASDATEVVRDDSFDIHDEEKDEFERQFNAWKQQNRKQPEAFAQYEEQGREWRAQLLQKKEQMLRSSYVASQSATTAAATVVGTVPQPPSYMYMQPGATSGVAPPTVATPSIVPPTIMPPTVMAPVIPLLRMPPGPSDNYSNPSGIPHNKNKKLKEKTQKLVLCINSSLHLQRGKLAAEAAKVAIEVCLKSQRAAKEAWLLTLKIEDEEAIERMMLKAEENDVPVTISRNKTFYKFPANCPFVLALGPAPVEKIDFLTSSLKLL